MKPLALRLPTPRMLLLLIAALSLTALACASSKAPGGRALRVGVAPGFAPVVFEQDGEIVGIEPDLARSLGERLGRRVVFERFREDELLGALERGDVDVVMSGLSITPERETRVLFATPYMQSGQLALIRAADLARFGRIHTLRRPGARVGYQSGTTGERFVATELSLATSFAFDDVEAGLRSLRAGRIDFFVHDAPTVWRIAGDPAQRDLHGLYQLLTDESLAWAVRRGDAALESQLDQAVAEWTRDGRIEAVIDRWIPVRVTVH
ncbi:MAG: transporter substrate-binding domain-containing protein [Deltaproteobacteria bacterium]|nr:transporter substrate-binding domain-containing protein [Deltaproteobacteria bacterium]